MRDSDLQPFGSLYESLPHKPSALPESVAAMNYKGLELLVAGLRIKRSGASSYHTHPLSLRLLTLFCFPLGAAHPDFASRFLALDKAIDQFTRTLPSPSYTEDNEPLLSDPPRLQTRMILPHLLVLAARINLHGIVAQKNEQSYQRCLNAAVDTMRMMQAAEDFDFNYFEVALSVSLLVLLGW